MPSSKQVKGTAGESIAARYLEQSGYRILERNYRYLKAEIDLIARQPSDDDKRGGELVFVEVKWRRGDSFAAPEAAVNATKRRHLIRAAEAFLFQRSWQSVPCRFDVISIVGAGSTLQIEHLEAAFTG